MIELNEEQYGLIEHFIGELEGDPIYPYSIVEKRQKGRVFVDDVEAIKNVLIWHYCGFAYVMGDGQNEGFNQSLVKLLEGIFEEAQSRFILSVCNEKWESLLDRSSSKLVKRRRLLFKFNEHIFRQGSFEIPMPYTIRKIDQELLDRIEGRIIPSFSWHLPDAFIKNGVGYCLMNGEEVVCTAFSSCIGGKKLDIGIETTPHYRGKGLGVITASKMVSEALAQGYEPDWGCDEQNLGSAAIAKRLGFEVCGDCYMYMKG